MRLVALSLILSIFTTNIARADDVASRPLIAPITAGQPAPFTGVVLNAPAVAQLAVERETAERECSLRVERDVARARAEATLSAEQQAAEFRSRLSVVEAERDARARDAQRLQELLKTTSQPISPIVWVGVGAAGGIVLTIATAFVITKL